MTQAQRVSDDWIEHHFDVHSHDLSLDLHGVLGRAREMCPVLHSDAYDGYWVATRFEDVLRIAQDWESFSSELGITVPHVPASSSSPTMKIIPVAVDPPLQRTFKRLINRYFTPAVVGPWEPATRTLVNRLIDTFIERGECEFMAEFARPGRCPGSRSSTSRCTLRRRTWSRSTSGRRSPACPSDPSPARR